MEKIIHYCWFGHGEKSDLILACMDSWKQFCPDYRIVEWNEENFDVNCCQYVREAYEQKKWAFVSDYCRFWVLFHHGGIYLDTDVKLLRSLDGLPKAFVGFENDDRVNSGLIRAARPGDSICKLMLDSYHDDTFILASGELNLKTVCERETEILKAYGLIQNNTRQTVCDTEIFPTEYFCPLDYRTNQMHITSCTYSIHMYGSSWHGPQEKYAGKLKAKLVKIFPAKRAAQIAYFVSIIKYDGLKAAINILKNKLS